MNKKCTGCGTTLQTTNQNEKGYIREDKYDNSVYCERCFKIIHYNEKIVTDLENINEYIIKEVNKKLPKYKNIRDFDIRDIEFVKTTTAKIKRQANLEEDNKTTATETTETVETTQE